MAIAKKIFILSALILFMSLLFWGVYNLSFKKSEAPKVADNKTNTSVDTKNKVPGIFPVSDEAVIAPTLTPDGNFIKYYAKNNGKVYQIDLDGKSKNLISGQVLNGLTDVIWSPDKTKAITKFSSSSGDAQFYSYDYNTQKGTAIKKNVDEIAWNANSNKIFYKYYEADTKKRSLNIANPDGTEWSKLTDIDYRNISISQIPQSGMVSFWNKADAYTETIFQSMPLVGGDKKTILGGKFGADYLWSADGNYVLVSNTDVRAGSKMQLSVMNSSGGEFKNLDIPTFASKCVWSKDNKTVYCALPGGMPPTAILPNDYLDNKFNTVDTFWKIDVKTGKKDRIIDPANIKDKYDATKLFLNSDESRLFFVNKNDGKIYRIDL